MSIFPEMNIEEEFNNYIELDEEVPVFKEYAVDFKTGAFLYAEDGRNLIVEGKEALKVWIWKALQITRNKYDIYTTNYGNEFEELIGQGYSKELVDSEMSRLVSECLSINRCIKSIENVTTTFEGSKVRVGIKAKTVYGEVELLDVQI